MVVNLLTFQGQLQLALKGPPSSSADLHVAARCRRKVHSARCLGVSSNPQPASFSPGLLLLQVYLILDEFIIAGEIQETSKKVGGSFAYSGEPPE